MRRIVQRVCSVAILILSAFSLFGSTQHWIGTWGAAAQPYFPAALQTFHNQTLRLIVHTSAGGKKVRIRISNTYGDHPLVIGAAHIARRSGGADIDPGSDRALAFHGHASVTIAARSNATSDPVDLDVPALSDLAISLFVPGPVDATTTHVMSKQANYVSAETGDITSAEKFPVAKTIHSWPFLTGVDVAASSHAATVVALGSSLTDGDGSTTDTNRRFPDVLAERLQKDPRYAQLGVLNEGIIGNRLLRDSPSDPALPFGASLGEAGVTRFDRDVLDQPGVKFVIIGLGINDIAFPGSLSPATEVVTTENLIAAYRQLIARAHKKGVRVIGTTNPPFEGAFLEHPAVTFYTSEKEQVREKVNDWIRTGGAFDGVVDLDQVVRDPDHPTRILPAYDSGDHIHPTNAGYVASGDAVPLALFE